MDVYPVSVMISAHVIIVKNIGLFQKVMERYPCIRPETHRTSNRQSQLEKSLEHQIENTSHPDVSPKYKILQTPFVS